jgi:hypothetical protein
MKCGEAASPGTQDVHGSELAEGERARGSASNRATTSSRTSTISFSTHSNKTKHVSSTAAACPAFMPTCWTPTPALPPRYPKRRSSSRTDRPANSGEEAGAQKKINAGSHTRAPNSSFFGFDFFCFNVMRFCSVQLRCDFNLPSRSDLSRPP